MNRKNREKEEKFKELPVEPGGPVPEEPV